MMCWFSNFSIS